MSEAARPVRRWRKLWIDLHTWLGLLISGVVLVLGVSSIVFNHRDWFPPRDSVEVRHVELGPQARDARHAGFHAAALRERLHFVGEAAFRHAHYRADGTLEFLSDAPGRRTEIEVTPAGGATIVEHRLGVAAALLGLHGSYGVEGSPLLMAWKLYTNLAIAGLVFAVPSGLWLWWPRRAATTPLGTAMVFATTLLFVVVAAVLY